jgi:hypothetical protein
LDVWAYIERRDKGRIYRLIEKIKVTEWMSSSEEKM